MAGAETIHQIIQDLFGEISDDEQLFSLRNEKDGGTNPEKEGKAKSEGEAELKSESVPKVLDHCQARTSRSPDNEKNAYQTVLSAAALSEVLRDYGSDHKEKGNYADAVPAEDVIYECEIAHTGKKYKGKAVDSPLVEIPLRHPSIGPDEMAAVRVSNIVGIDPKPFDPSTYVEEDFFVTDASGFKRRIPSNIICWRKVKNPDGTTSVESNAHFVTWSDGSLQLFIGNENFNVSEQDAKEIQSHIFLKHTKMATVSVSNIVGIYPKLFDPSTYVEEDFFLMDASGFKRHIPSNNIIRWRKVNNPDGTSSVESNTCFVPWSDRSLQLLEMKASVYLNKMRMKFICTFSFP